MAYPESNIGGRYYQEPPESLSSLKPFHDRITDCLNSSLSLNQRGCHGIPTLEFSAEAKSLWISFFNQIELDLTGKWSSIKDFASKAPENVARLAGLFHLFSGRESSVIEIEQIEQAIPIIIWHMEEARKILGYKETPSLEHQDAMQLLNWLKKKETIVITPREIQQLSPIRERDRRNRAIDILIKHNYLKHAIQDGKAYLQLNPKG